MLIININEFKHEEARKIFVNLPVKELNKSVEFFTNLGFKFDPKFTDKNTTCMIVNETIFVMLLVEIFFRTFSQKEKCNTAKNIELILALSVEGREIVDELVDKAINAGGIEPLKLQDHGWMHDRSFDDIDGYLSKLVFMNGTKIM
ncbi:VOC family protein [Candidatus Nitrosocosmicus sp. FF01]|jgi:predicted lactoylglutathione lyase|uniref:VOC family protein n=1 Tax=Candidatus Nitrosocosmicus sp. FF01 TaxID=3397670 RepID=UPI0039E99563